MTLLGIPSDKGWYARNIWDMILFNGKVYFGTGNASNVSNSPNRNAGPTSLYSYTAVDGFVTETTLQEQQIGKFEVINNQLVIPGMDRMSGFISSWYRLESGSYVQYQNINNNLHVYSMKEFNNVWYATLGSNINNNIAKSVDQGANWTELKAPTNVIPVSYPSRAFEIFQVANDLVISTSVYTASGVAYEAVKLSGTDFVPALEWFWFLGNKLARTVAYKGEIIALDVTINNDHQWIPNQVVVIHDDYTVDTVTIPNGDRVQDLKVVGNRLYALSNKQIGTRWRIVVSATDDLINWKEVAYMDAAAFGRSMAVDFDKVYIGLGGDTTATASEQASVGEVHVLPIAQKRFISWMH